MNRTHGFSGTRLHGIWKGMRNRCNNPNFPKYRLYGGRGIRVCERWNDFMKFREDMGEPPTLAHSLDRIDGNGSYEPGNVRWATPTEQARNVRKVSGNEAGSICITPPGVPPVYSRKPLFLAAHKPLLRDMIIEIVVGLSQREARA